MQKAIGYCRVSSAMQAQEGVSLDAQKAAIEQWAKASGYELIAIQTDAGLSGGRADNRPGLQAAIERACLQKAALVVYSLSRLARSTKDALEISEKLQRAGADLVSLSERIETTSAAGKMIFRLMAVLAEFERDQIRERTKSALSYLRSQRIRVGAVPFGFQLAEDGKTLVQNPQQMPTVKKIVALRQKKGAGFAMIAAILNALNVPPGPSAKVWYPRSVFNTYYQHVPRDGDAA